MQPFFQLPELVGVLVANDFLVGKLGIDGYTPSYPAGHVVAKVAVLVGGSTPLVSCLVCLTHRQTAGTGATARQILRPAHALDHGHQVGITVGGSVAATAR